MEMQSILPVSCLILIGLSFWNLFCNLKHGPLSASTTVAASDKFAAATVKACLAQRYDDINSMNLTENDFMPYRCFNHNDRYLTVLGMHLKEFNDSKLRFQMNGIDLTDVEIHSGHRTFVINAAINRTMVRRNEQQMFQYRVGACRFTMECSNYYYERKEELNLCVYTTRKLEVIQPFLDFYRDFVDRIFIYNNERKNEKSFMPLQSDRNKFQVIPWYLDELRDLKISSLVYDELVAHNYRNYSRDAQKVQTNDCMYKNRETDMVLMVDDDEYLNFLNRKFYGQLYSEVKHEYDDIVMYRNFCNTSVVVETRLSAVIAKSTAECPMKSRPRLEKAFVLPRNCRLYEIHRCTSAKSYSLRHLNIYVAHSPYPKALTR